MMKVDVKYNPYFLTTEIRVNGNKPKENSDLNYSEGMRLQEWIDSFLPTLKAEYRDSDYSFVYHGTTLDYQDFCFGVDGYEVVQVKIADVEEVVRDLYELFKDIHRGPIVELQNLDLKKAFDKFDNAEFEVNVVGMSSPGKSTLINALMGQQLMPVANEATTATIVKIIDTDQKNFSAVAYDANGNVVKEIKEVKLNDMKTLNCDAKVSTVEIYGKIPFVQSTGMKLVLVDTPGPNNSRDANHQKMTYQMLENSDKSLVLYVMNALQLGINDESAFLNFICDNMKQGGKQSRDRFIFAVNKMDCFSVKGDGEGCIEKAMDGIKGNLEARGIMNPNEFPVSACAALELRTDEEEPMVLDQFRRKAKIYDEFKFDKYYDFSHLALDSRERIEKRLAAGDELDEVLIHSGIVSIEEAICQYINKYVKTTKIKEFALSLKRMLVGLKEIAKLQKLTDSENDASKKKITWLESIENRLNAILYVE